MVPNSAFAEGDVYIDYPKEQVMFRWQRDTKKAFRRLYGQTENEETEISFDNDFFNEAIRSGTQVSAAQYQAGKKATT